jgi:hypothetical protein
MLLHITMYVREALASGFVLFAHEPGLRLRLLSRMIMF